MAVEDLLRQYNNAFNSEEQARQEAENLVREFQGIAKKLDNWQKVEFEGEFPSPKSPTGVALKRSEIPGAIVIRADDLPPLWKIDAAIAEWRKAAHKLRGIWDRLTEADRQIVKQPPR